MFGRTDRLLQLVVHELLELGARQLHLQVLRSGLVSRDEREVDVGLHHGGQLHLGLLGGLLEALERHPVPAQIDAVALPELANDPVDDPVIQVVAAEVRVPVGGLHLDHAFSHFENRDVECAAAEIVDGDRFVLLLVETVGERRGGRLVDNAHHLEPGNVACVLRRLALGVVEIRGNGDDRVGNRLSEVLLGGLLQLLEHHRRDLRRRVLLAVGRHPRVVVRGAHHLVRHHLHLFGDLGELAAHEPLDREHGVFRVGDRLTFGDLAYQALPRPGKSHDRRRQPATLGVGDDDRLPAFHDRHNRVGGAEVDADDLAH